MTVGYCLFNKFYIDVLNFVTLIVISALLLWNQNKVYLSDNDQEQSSPLETSPTNTNSRGYFSSWYLNEYFKIQNSSSLSDNFIWKILI